MARRLPSQPPVLPGFSHMHVLGSGGFADVFLYEQNMPRRQVAVKVMLSEIVNDQVRQMFQGEANLMAGLSGHPSILTVFQASVSADGRPYIVMELCSSALNDRYRRERIPVAEVLRIAIKIGSAVETAHRQGILHRDIKPSNILLTAYGHPVLSDFGIATSLGESEPTEIVGLSIPWSAPEVLREATSGTVASEVWSLGATVYSLLAGRSPFESLGARSTPGELMQRIEKGRLQPIGRTDVPASLESTLARAMSHRPESRQAGVLEMVREFQQTESELGVSQTPIEVAVDDWALATVTDLEDRTHVRVAAASSSASTGRRRRRVTDPDRQARALQAGGAADNALLRSTGARSGQTGPRRSQSLMWSLAAAIVVLLALGGGVTYSLVRSSASGIPRVTDITAVTKGSSVEFRWADPGLRPDDTYIVTSGTDTKSTQQASTFLAPVVAGQEVCITVEVIRSGKNGPASAQKCASAKANE